MHLASLACMAEGWKNGRFLGRLSANGLAGIFVSVVPKMNLLLVKIPVKVLSGFLSLTLEFWFDFEDVFAEFLFEEHSVDFG